MAQPIIKVEGLSKSFVISHEVKERYTSLGEVISKRARSVFNGGGSAKPTSTKEEFWALNDVSFEINHGDRVGIVGRNGAGKSTLLKILSRITEPTRGRIDIEGRVASLLEVGTGFHPELTGRENIFLNGAILGMSRAEIRSKFDEIVEFAEVEKFLDTPVKRYSSGMYVRLAFAVAAHLEPEILIVDEVLAVGDAQFQKKCLGKMEDVSKNDGRTVLFVSHNMNVINALCNTSILLTKGQIEKRGHTAEVLGYYLMGEHTANNKFVWEVAKRPGNGIVKLNGARMVDRDLNLKSTFSIDEEVGIELNYEVLTEGKILWQGHNVTNIQGVNIFDTHNVTSEYYTKPHPVGKFTSIAWIPANLLSEGTYTIGSAIFNHVEHIIHFHEKDILLFTIIDTFTGATARGVSVEEFPGIVRPLLNWQVNKVNNE